VADTTPKPFVFVLMPFEASFNDVYELGIKPASESAGAYCERLDEQIFDESMLARIYNQVAKADLVVADMTSRNPNVFYEVGYAHALGKTVILLTKNADDIPFDLKHYPHIVYQGSIVDLKERLQRRITHHLANPVKTLEVEIVLPRFVISGNAVESGASIKALTGDVRGGQCTLTVGVSNPYDTVPDWSGLSAGLLLPSEYVPETNYAAVKIEDGRYLYDLGSIGRLFPGAWSTKVIYLPHARMTFGVQIDAELRVFTPQKPLSTLFHLTFLA